MKSMQTKTLIESMNLISKFASRLNYLEYLADHKKLTLEQKKERLRLRGLRAIVWNNINR